MQQYDPEKETFIREAVYRYPAPAWSDSWTDASDQVEKGEEDKRAIEEETVGWHHQLNGHEFEQSLGDSEGQGSLMCCSPWGHKELDMT